MHKRISELITRLGIENVLYTYKCSTLCLRFNSEADVFGLMKYLRFENYKVVDYNAGVETIHTELGVSHNKVSVHGTGYSIDLFVSEPVYKKLIASDLRFRKGFENIDTVLTNRSDRGAIFSNGVKVGELQVDGVEYGYNFALPDDVKITNENVLDFIAHFYVSREDEHITYKGLLTPEGSEILSTYEGCYGKRALRTFVRGFLLYFAEFLKNTGYKGVCTDPAIASERNLLVVPEHLCPLLDANGYCIVTGCMPNKRPASGCFDADYLAFILKSLYGDIDA